MRRAAPHVSAAAATSHSGAIEHPDDANEGQTTGTFRWLTPHHLALGPLAIGCAIAYQKVGLVGLLAFGLPRHSSTVSVAAVHSQDTRRGCRDRAGKRRSPPLQRRASSLERRSRGRLPSSPPRSLPRPTTASSSPGMRRASLAAAHRGDGRVTVGDDPAERATALRSARADRRRACCIEGGDAERWERLRDAVEPQLATALESTTLAEEVRKTHLETIAALSRSMEAKDNYTGGHTERVSDIAVGLAQRLGYTGADLDAIEIGALMHDIGKIGIPESILHKPGPLDDDEWIVMKRHPVISELILSEIDLSPIVLQIARSIARAHGRPGLPGRARRRGDPAAGADRARRRRLRRADDRPSLPPGAAPEGGARGDRAPTRARSSARRSSTALERLYREEPARCLGESRLTVSVACAARASRGRAQAATSRPSRARQSRTCASSSPGRRRRAAAGSRRRRGRAG